MYKIQFRIADGDSWVTIAAVRVETVTEVLIYARSKICRRFNVAEVTLRPYAKHIWTVFSQSSVMGFVKVTLH